MKIPKLIKVKIYYDDNLKKITGKGSEEAFFSENTEFRMLLHFIFSSYPKIPEKFIPTTLGFSLNGAQPQSETVLRDGDKLRVCGFSIGEVRDGIKKKVEEILRRYDINLNFESIERMIYEEENQDDYNALINIFSEKISNIDTLNDALQLFNAAWNCFPHKCLGNLCPMEKLAESQSKGKHRKPKV